MWSKSVDERVSDIVHSFIKEKEETIDEVKKQYSSDSFWRGLKETGSDLWLDTGDIEAAGKLWTADFTALTTNNTLLNTEIQKGIYDTLIAEAGKLLSELPIDDRVMEIAFILNAFHGLRLVHKFGGKVSVELHTAIAHDIDRTVLYARRFSRIAPRNFIIKVPLTPSGLIATRIIRGEGIAVNFTLGFSARHNYIAAAFAFPSYVNVFLGRLNSYVSDNRLGDGRMVGEKATVSSQRSVRAVSDKNNTPTLQIAASMRESSQVGYLAGIDVLTMPVKVAESAKKELPGDWESCIDNDYSVSLFSGIDVETVGLSKLWSVSEEVVDFTASLLSEVPEHTEDLIKRSHEFGVWDVFPDLSEQDRAVIAKDGKIPKHERWEQKIKKGTIAIDTLLNLSGIASFTGSQDELDSRIRRLLRD